MAATQRRMPRSKNRASTKKKSKTARLTAKLKAKDTKRKRRVSA